MSSERSNSNIGFRIKWGDKEIEYFGDSSKDLFITVFDYFKSTPKAVSNGEKKGKLNLSSSSTSEQILGQDDNTISELYERISLDAGVPIEQVKKVIMFEKKPDFPDLVPMLVSHPQDRDAITLAAYSLQVGLKKTQIELVSFKKILCGPNNYQFPGSTLGSILADFRKCNWVSASTAQGRNKPFSLTKEGLDKSRDLVRNA